MRIENPPCVVRISYTTLDFAARNSCSFFSLSLPLPLALALALAFAFAFVCFFYA